MILRPRQKDFVERSLSALLTHGNALGVAPTGAGKTIQKLLDVIFQQQARKHLFWPIVMNSPRKMKQNFYE